MDKKDFLQAKGFIFSDIQREIDLFDKGEGAGNFLCALGLLCYTEFFGGVLSGNFRDNGKNFKTFFASMGSHYSDLLRNHNVYGDVRCGLAHQFFVDKGISVAIETLKGRKDVGLDYLQTQGRYVFRLKPYFRDFKTTVEMIEKQKYT